MSDRIFYALAVVCAVLMIGFALAWPDRPGRGDFNATAEASQ